MCTNTCFVSLIYLNRQTNIICLSAKWAIISVSLLLKPQKEHIPIFDSWVTFCTGCTFERGIGFFGGGGSFRGGVGSFRGGVGSLGGGVGSFAGGVDSFGGGVSSFGVGVASFRGGVSSFGGGVGSLWTGEVSFGSIAFGAFFGWKFTKNLNYSQYCLYLPSAVEI